MRWGLIVVLCGCHVIIDPDDHIDDATDASTDAGTDASLDASIDASVDSNVDAPGLDAGHDAGCGMLPMTTMGPPCCFDDGDCPLGGRDPLVCHGATCGGEPGVCFPRTDDGRPGSNCFIDADCISGSCEDGPNCGCGVPCESMMPRPGSCT